MSKTHLTSPSPPIRVGADKWEKYEPGTVYRCKVILSPPDEDGRIVVHAASLPGVVSQGDSEEEALRNIVEALEGTIPSYDDQIPWLPVSEWRQASQHEKERWILVHV